MIRRKEAAAKDETPLEEPTIIGAQQTWGPLGEGIPWTIPEERLDQVLSVVSSQFKCMPTGMRCAVGQLVQAAETGQKSVRWFGIDGFEDYLGQYVVSREGKPPASLAKMWLRSPQRANVEGLIVESDPSKADPSFWNLWEGFTVKPKAGDWSLFQDLMRDILCAKDDISYTYLLKWTAWCLQNPTKLPGVAVVLKGKEGAGKGTYGNAMVRLFGSHGLAVHASKHLTGNFNAHRALTCFLFADESFFAGDPAGESVLKASITEDLVTIEPKGMQAYQMRNRLKILMATNDEHAVRASAEARRYFVLQVDESRIDDRSFFARIRAQLDAGGLEAMLHDLLAMDLSGFDVRARPDTKALGHEREHSLKGIEQWALTFLTTGTLCGTDVPLTEVDAGKAPIVLTGDLHASLVDFWKTTGQRGPVPHIVWLGRFMHSLGAKQKTVAQGKLRGKMGYRLCLETARAALVKRTKIVTLFSEET